MDFSITTATTTTTHSTSPIDISSLHITDSVVEPLLSPKSISNGGSIKSRSSRRYSASAADNDLAPFSSVPPMSIPAPPCAAVDMSSIAPLTPENTTTNNTASLEDYFYRPRRATTPHSVISNDLASCCTPIDSIAQAADAAAEAMATMKHVEGHRSYKIKAAKSSKKLDHFFGEQAPLDICIKEIQREGLKAILQSKTPLCYFLYHLLQEYSSENLFFFIEVEQYESFHYTTFVQQLATAQHIHSTYLTRNSHFEVNFDDKVRRTVSRALEQRQLDGCFDAAKRAVYGLLESSYMRFLTTDTFQSMVENCGELTTHYSKDARNSAIHQLMSYIERQHILIYTNTDPSAATTAARRRHELIRSMVHEFCRTILGVHIEYPANNKPKSSISSKPFDFLTRLKQGNN